MREFALSPLSVDLALHDIRIAAIKAKNGIAATESEREAAASLRYHLESNLPTEPTASSLASADPGLVAALAALSPPTVEGGGNRRLIDEIIAVLLKVEQRTSLSGSEADRLLGGLETFKPPTPDRSEIHRAVATFA
jgi:hypothetical protein